MAILVISDIHANLAALEAVLEDAGPVDGILSLGDMVGYGPQPNEVIARLRQGDAGCVAGNHEWAVLGRLDLREFNPVAAAAARWTAATIGDEASKFLGELPVRLQVDGTSAVHGSARDPIWEYVTSGSIARASFGHFETPVCFFGHTHIPAAYTARGASLGPIEPHTTLSLAAGERYMLNPGSVGQPRDGDPRAAYLLWNPEERTATWRRVAYDIPRTQGLMVEAGLPEILWRRLSLGR